MFVYSPQYTNLTCVLRQSGEWPNDFTANNLPAFAGWRVLISDPSPSGDMMGHELLL